MNFNGKTPQQIFASMSWQNKIITVAGSLYLLMAFIYVPLKFLGVFAPPPQRPGPVGMPTETDVTGYLDPSIVTVDKKNIYMAYTASKRVDSEKNAPVTEVRIAKAAAPCNMWYGAPGGFASRAEEIVGPDGVTPVKAGIWRAETPTLLYDPADKGHEWKLFAYRYFWSGDAPLARLYSMIVYASADAKDIKWTDEEWLFSANANTPPVPYGKLVHQHLNDLDPSLADVYFYARPSAIMTGNTIVMTLSAFVKGRDSVDRVILIASGDHGRSWKYLGTILRHADIAGMGKYTRLGGGTLLKDGDKVYFSAVLGDDKVTGLGAFIMSFENLGKGLLVRDKKTGVPVVLNHVARLSTAPTVDGGGYAAYSPACDSGIITSEYSGRRQDFALFRTLAQPGKKQ